MHKGRGSCRLQIPGQALTSGPAAGATGQ